MGGYTGVEDAVSDTCESAGRNEARRIAARGLVLAGCCFGLMAAFWLLSGSSAHAATTSRAAPASSTPGSAGSLLGSVTSTVSGVVNGVTSTVNGAVSGVTKPAPATTAPGTPAAS